MFKMIDWKDELFFIDRVKKIMIEENNNRIIDEFQEDTAFEDADKISDRLGDELADQGRWILPIVDHFIG